MAKSPAGMTGTQLQAIRERLGLKRWEFAQLIRASTQSVWLWETGRGRISEKNALYIRSVVAK